MILLWMCCLFGCGGGGSAVGGGGGSGGGGGTSPTLTLAANPNGLIIYPGGSFSVVVTASASGTQATPSVTLGTLPAGISTTASFPMSVPAAGATINFTTLATVGAGNYNIPISGSASAAVASLSEPLTVMSGAPSQASFESPMFTEAEVAEGGTAKLQLQVLNNATAYDISLSAQGLPAGVTATFDPQEVLPGGQFTVTLSAAANAPVAQNVAWTITGAPSANVSAASLSLLLNVVAPNNVGWSNQTSYVSTRATPYAAVYDPAHQVIYAANTVWNELDIISDKTRALVGSLSVRDPQAVGLSVDGSTVWIGTGSQVVYGLNTTTQKMTRYILPPLQDSSLGDLTWEDVRLFSLYDGTVLLEVKQTANGGSEYAAIWNPTTNALRELTGPAMWGNLERSGDGKRVFSIGGDELETSFTYDVTSGSFSPAQSLSSFGYGGEVASNSDGSRIAVTDVNGLTVYDGNLNRIGMVPGDGGWGTIPIQDQLWGGFVFSADGSKLYEETESTKTPTILSFDTSNLQLLTVSPAMPVIPVMVELSPSFYMPTPFAVDSAGMVLGIQYHGISFDDATVNLDYSAAVPGPPTFLQHASVYSGPLGVGTAVSGFGNAFSLLPDVYFGGVKGTASLSSNTLSITSPPASTSGPVDVKLLFPDGNEVFDPQFFTYGTKIQDAVVSGGPPQGGAAAQLSAWGLPIDPSGDQVTIGRNSASVTSTQTQSPPFTGEQSAMYLSYTTPSGAPGWSDLTVTTPNGSDTLKKGFFFAKSVTDYAITDSATFVLYDPGRNQLYLSAGDHIDVFSLSSNSFTSPLQGPAVGPSKQFQGLALTPDGKYLLAADLTDYSLSVIDPDNAANSYAIKVAYPGPGVDSCPTGPLYVAPDNLGNAYVVTGNVPAPNCGPGGIQVVVQLRAKTSNVLENSPTCPLIGAVDYETATNNGSVVAFSGAYGLQLYNPATDRCTLTPRDLPSGGLASSADGNLIGMSRAFLDPSGTLLGRAASPQVFYPTASLAGDNPFPNPAVNAAGSLYYTAYANYVDIVDVQHGTPALRMGLTESVSNTVSPMAIDSSGQHVFLITNKGLTVVDLGEAPLSIGHMSQQTVSAGAQIQIRGSGFEEGMTATVGGTPAMVSYQDSETVTLTVPAVSSGIQDLVLANPDGTTYALQSAVTVP